MHERGWKMLGCGCQFGKMDAAMVKFAFACNNELVYVSGRAQTNELSQVNEWLTQQIASSSHLSLKKRREFERMLPTHARLCLELGASITAPLKLPELVVVVVVVSCDEDAAVMHIKSRAECVRQQQQRRRHY